MMSRLVRVQLIVFVIVAILGVIYVGAKYVRLDQMVGLNVYTVTAQFPDSGGIFPNAEVTYQGVPVGRVGDMHWTAEGVDVELRLNSSGPKVPANAKAVVADRSAIGEQYVDLRPTSNDGPRLRDGSVIKNGSIPVPVQDVVADAVSFLQDINVDDLHTVITELGKAFNGQALNLRSLVDSLDNLSRAGADNLPATISLLRNSDIALGTQADQSDQILSWAHNLDLLTATLASSDPDIRRLLTTGQTSAKALSALLDQSGDDIGQAVRDLASDVKYNQVAINGLGSILTMLEVLQAQAGTTAPGDGTIHFAAVLETNDPPPCTVGYEGTQAIIDQQKAKDPNFDINYDDFPFNFKANCVVAQGNPTDVRGAKRVVLADPSIPQPWDNKPKKDPDKLNLNPVAQQLAALMGVRSK